MRQERSASADHQASVVFDEQEQQMLQVLNQQLEGKTQKQQNPYRQHSLAWAVWVIAVLGGWTPGNMSKRPPGVISLARGLKHFRQQYAGWKIALTHFQQIVKNST